MGERRPQNRYIPMNFNSDLLQRRGRGRDRLINVRNMLPMTIRCNTCSNYHYIGTKFTMRMEICNDQMYLGIKVFRFYFRCTHCCNQITFKTDPKNAQYVVQTGGVRNYDPKRDIQQAEKILKKIKTQEQQGDTMKTLQNKTYDSKRQMQLMQVLQEIRNANKRHITIQSQDLLKRFYQNQILEVAQTQQQQQAMNRQYQQKVAQFNKKHQLLDATKTFNHNVRVQKQRRQKERQKQQFAKRKLKPQIKTVIKKRQVEDKAGQIKVIETNIQDNEGIKYVQNKTNQFKTPKDRISQLNHQIQDKQQKQVSQKNNQQLILGDKQ